MELETAFYTYIAEVDLMTESGERVMYRGQCGTDSIPDPDDILDKAIHAALSYRPGAKVVESRMWRT